MLYHELNVEDIGAIQIGQLRGQASQHTLLRLSIFLIIK